MFPKDKLSPIVDIPLRTVAFPLPSYYFIPTRTLTLFPTPWQLGWIICIDIYTLAYLAIYITLDKSQDLEPGYVPSRAISLQLRYHQYLRSETQGNKLLVIPNRYVTNPHVVAFLTGKFHQFFSFIILLDNLLIRINEKLVAPNCLLLVFT